MDEQERQVENQWIFQQMVEPLVTWYDQNARILPWRENNAPYGVWISEIMLQQTRVETVIPYYERFMQKLPTVESLAEVGEELLLKLWEGLGYYARVRNLQKAARVICRDYQGKFPDSYQKILQLPGIGAYTAGAIVSISFGQPIAAVDGNVLRVISRLTENEQDIASPALKKEITKALETVYPRSRSGDFTQSLMELGAMICIPHGVPQCTICPVAFLCRANHHHTQLLLPVQAKKPARKRQLKTILLLCCEERIAVRKRAAGGLLGGLWEFPNLEGMLTAEEVRTWLNHCGITVHQVSKGRDQKHIFTHVEWLMSSYIVNCRTSNSEFVWVTREYLHSDITLPTAFKKFADCW